MTATELFNNAFKAQNFQLLSATADGMIEFRYKDENLVEQKITISSRGRIFFNKTCFTSPMKISGIVYLMENYERVNLYALQA